MAKYTVELKTLVESDFDLQLDDYPIFDDAYRDVLNEKIINHYYFHEIGFETAERFRFEMKRKMVEIMTLFNQRYDSQIKINPLVNFRKVTSVSASEEASENETMNTLLTDSETSAENTTGTRADELINQNDRVMSRTGSRTGEQDSESVSAGSTKDKAKDIRSDTPTSNLLIGDIEDNVYASEANVAENDRDTTQNSSQAVNELTREEQAETDASNQRQTTSSDLTSDTASEKDRTSETDVTKDHRRSGSRNEFINDEGITISESELLIRWRETFLNIDMEVIDSLRPLFMQVL